MVPPIERYIDHIELIGHTSSERGMSAPPGEPIRWVARRYRG
jgi:hypothetical protein